VLNTSESGYFEILYFTV